MEQKHAVLALSALAHDHRLAAFRLLVRAGDDGLPAGEIAERLRLPPSSLSFHLTQLVQAGLVRSWRVSRHVLYAIDCPATQTLLRFLSQDCCMGLPALCCEPVGQREVGLRELGHVGDTI